MAFPAVFSNFSKRVNSTARPASSGTTINVELKNPCSIMRPRLKLVPIQSVNFAEWNYCYIAQWSRYYWVSDWTWEDGLWVASLNIDVLASWKDTIGASTLYVLRSASDYNLDVIDTMYPAKVGPYYSETNATLEDWSLGPSLSSGTYVLGTVNGLQGGTYGPVTYYAVSPSVMAEFMSYMLSQVPEWEDITDLSGDIAKTFIDPFQYIVSCKWFPFTINTTSSQNMCFGFWQSSYKAGLMNNATEFYKQWTFNMTRPARQDAGARGEWLYLSPFASYWLTLYPWGTVPINGQDIDGDGIICNVLVDFISGLGTLRIRSQATGSTPQNNSRLLTSQQAKVGVDIQISQITNDLLGAVTSPNVNALIADVISDLMRPGNIMTDATFPGASAGASVSAKSSGSNSGLVSSTVLAGSAVFTAEYLDPVNENLTENGRPLMEMAQISTLSGYIKVMDGDVKFPGTSEELTAVRQYLEGGFYYE